MILIICALRLEAKPFLNALEYRKAEKIGSLKCFHGELCGAKVIIVQCGVGVLKAADVACSLIDKHAIACIIMSGTAGGIDRSLRVGDTVVSDEILFHDDAGSRLKREGHTIRNTTYRTNSALLENVKKAIAENPPAHPVHFGKIATGRKFVASKDFDSITAKVNPLCADMESAAIAHVSSDRGIPFIAVRSISDNVGNPGFGTFFRYAQIASQNSFAVTCRILKVLSKIV